MVVVVVVGFFFFFFCLFVFLRASSVACGVPRLGVGIGAVVASLHHSHSSVGSELHLRPTTQLKATQIL